MQCLWRVLQSQALLWLSQSLVCQKFHSVSHIFDCKPRRPITTADHLALAVIKNLFPQDTQTCKDYGFERAFTAENRSKLLGLYIGQMDPGRIGIPPETINDWRVRGVLVEEIKAAYYKIPAQFRGGYFPWFLQNQHILDPSAVSQSNEKGDTMVLHAWRFTGGSETDSPTDIRARIKEEMYLGGCYQVLIIKCTFDEFCNAYRSARILKLFRKNGIDVNVRYLSDVLQKHRMNKSVWDLKQFAMQTDEQNPEGRIANSVACDYGFMNCRKNAETQALKKIYRTFFERLDADPLALHDAAIRGNIFGYLGSLMKLNKSSSAL
ncbi:hypothetical protein BDR07DRAFT_1464234 [Suillus spraguei]|nr:hypothetical protein BDR07DRAFT_1464234 [Suillus spraguei]